MNCNSVPNGKAKEAIERTQETGQIHAFLQSRDGTTTEIFEGGDTSIDIEKTFDGPVSLFYAHPSNMPIIAPAAREVLHRDDVGMDMVCVGIEHDGDALAFCERSQPSCARTLEQSSDECPFE